MNKSSTGTDGFRVLCHQFTPSSNSPQVPSLKSLNTSSQILLSRLGLRTKVDQTQKIFLTASQKLRGQRSSNVSLNTSNPPAKSQPITGSHGKRYAVSYELQKRLARSLVWAIHE